MHPPVPFLRLTPLALALGGLLTGPAARAGDDAAAVAPAVNTLQPSRSLQALPRGDAARQQPIVLRAREITARPDLDARADGDVEFRRGGLVIRADTLSYDVPADLATARGKVRVARDGAVYTGPELQLSVQRFEGFFLDPIFEFPLIGAGGRADRIDFLDTARSAATNASYTSCPRDGSQEPAWALQARRLSIDTAMSEGVAEGAVLRFLGTPILAWPSLSFPLADQRRSGWLPPSTDYDSRGGLALSVPYYWDIAPNRDATIEPRLITKRGLALDGEFRYLEASDRGSLALKWLPNDRVAGRSRNSLQWGHSGDIGVGLRYSADVLRVSDDDWWKDFRGAAGNLTTRLLPLRAVVEQTLRWQLGPLTADGLAYARTTQWQVLQDSASPIASPYQRSPQVGLRLGANLAGWQLNTESEYNRFTLPAADASRAGRPQGQRLHLLGSLSRSYRDFGLWWVPRLAVNAAAYDTQASPSATAKRSARVIPSLSVDAGMELERRTQAFGRDLQQTLEPRLTYVNTPYRAQSQLPNFDSAGKDFNTTSIFTDNAFTGVDRVADAHQLTAGVTTRLVDADSGAEALRLGLAQRYLFRTQRVAPQADGSLDGAPLTQRFSDALVTGSSSVIPDWTLDAAVQYSPDISRAVRSIIGARYAPGPFRTVGATYRLARGLNEQVEVAWQWPVGTAASQAVASANQSRRSAAGGGSCSGAWYSVGRVNFSVKDSRVTDSVMGLEYDAGCWIARVVAERLSTGRSQATTRLFFQLELVGLSRIGSNPLKVLKDNIPGYRLLRDDRGGAQRSEDWQPAP
jgi:LPS-assembly protein